VTNRTNRRFRSFKELLAMTAQTGFVTRIFGDVRKGIRFSDGFPVSGRKLMTRVALHFMALKAMRKFGISRAALWCNCRALRLGSRFSLLRARAKKFRCPIRVKNPARERANERDNQRGARFSDSFCLKLSHRKALSKIVCKYLRLQSKQDLFPFAVTRITAENFYG